MEIAPIRTEEDLENALQEIEYLVDARPGSADEDRLLVLSILVEHFEDEHYFIPDPDPIEAIIHTMEALGLARSDLEPFLGSRARVSEILNRRRRLSLVMIRRLEEGLGIPAEVLIQPYELEDSGAIADERSWIVNSVDYQMGERAINLDMDSLPSGTSLQFIRRNMPQLDRYFMTVAGAMTHDRQIAAETHEWVTGEFLSFTTVSAVDLGNTASSSIVQAIEAIVDDTSTEDADSREAVR